MPGNTVRERSEEAGSGSATTQGVWLFAKQTERQSKKNKKKEIHDEAEEEEEEEKSRETVPGTNGSTKISAALHFNVSILAGINSRVFMLAALENQPAHTQIKRYILCVRGPPRGSCLGAALLAPLEVQINNN